MVTPRSNPDVLDDEDLNPAEHRWSEDYPGQLPPSDEVAGQQAKDEATDAPDTFPEEWADNSSKPALGRDKLGELERNSPTTGSNSGSLGELNKLNYTGAGAAGATTTAIQGIATIFGKNKKKALAGGGITATIVGSIIGFSVFSGFGPVLLLTQMMDRVHFSQQNEVNEDRVSKLIRYVKDPNRPERTRMGHFGNKFADKASTRLKNVGIESRYTPTFGLGDGFNIDSEKYGKAAGLGDNATPKQVAEHLNRQYPGKAKVQNGVIIFGEGGLSRGEFNKFLRPTLRAAGYNSAASYAQSRLVGKRAKVATWHPMSKLDDKATRKADKVISEWQKKRAERLRIDAEGSGRTANSSSDNQDTPENEGKNGAENNGEGDQISRDAQNTGSEAGKANSDTPYKDFQSRLNGKLVVGSAAVAGIACLLRGIDTNAKFVKQARVIEPAIGIGAEALAMGDQIKSGVDVDPMQVAAYKDLLYDKESGTAWNQANTIKADIGEPQNGVDPEETLTSINKGTPFAFLNEGNTGKVLRPICDSAIGQGALFIVGFLGGPASAISGEIVGRIAGPKILSYAAKWLSGAPLGYARGANLGNQISYGVKMMALQATISGGGRVLSKAEASEMKVLVAQEQAEEFQDKSLAYKLFARNDYRSAIGRATIDMPQKPLLALTRIGTFGSKILPSYLFTARVSAATSQGFDYGFDDLGYSLDELENKEVDNPYKNAKVVAEQILPGNNGSKYIDRAKKCMGTEVSADGSITSYGSSELIMIQDFENNSDCSDTSLEWLRMRYFVLDSMLSDSLSCYEGDAEACTLVGVGATDSSSENGISGEGAGRIVSVAMNEYNINGGKDLENPSGSNRGTVVQKYTQGDVGPWCAWFVSWVYRAAGYEFEGDPAEADGDIPAVVNVAKWFKANGILFGPNDPRYKPQPGDVIMYNVNLNGDSIGSEHTGVVVFVDGNLIKTVEGNTSGTRLDDASTGEYAADSGAVGGKVYRNYKTDTSRPAIYGRLKTL